MVHAEHLPVLDPHNVLMTVDGPSGTGKERFASAIGRRLGIPVFNTGQVFRTWARIAEERNLLDIGERGMEFGPRAAEQILAWCNNPYYKPRFVEMTDGTAHVFWGERRDMMEELRWYRHDPDFQKQLETIASSVAAHPGIRREAYRIFSHDVNVAHGGVVVGRNVGIEPFSYAHLKVVLHADPEVVARARFAAGAQATDSVVQEMEYIARRDGRDGHNGLLAIPQDAFVIDTTRWLLERRGMEKVVDIAQRALSHRYNLVKSE